MKRLVIMITCLIGFLTVMVVLPTSAEATNTSSITEVAVGSPIEEHPELFLARSMPTRGEGKIAVFLIDFPDYKGLTSVEHYENVYFGNEAGQVSVSSFYADQSHGKLSLDGEVFGWYTAKHNRSHYDNKKTELVMEAAEFYRGQGIDFSDFDGDSDGVIDALTFHFAGEVDDSQSNAWYEGVTYSSSGEFGQIGNTKLTKFVQMAEAVTTFTICHEFGHTLGLPDLYIDKAQYIDPLTDLMSHNLLTINPYFRLLLGWEDKVSIVTSEMDKIRLEPDDFVIVTNEFNGFFDEFYIVTYRVLFNETNPMPVVLHVDARLNESGTEFMNSNHTYDPTPESSDSAVDGEVSEYLFIEELSFSPFYDRILNNSDHVFAGEDSVLGPDSVPSSDTHHGEFTGLRIDTFFEYENEYMTFNVSFAKDVKAPMYVGGDDEIVFADRLSLTFSECIYEGTEWDGIQVTDIDGKPLNATVIVSRAPHHILKIVFKDESYTDGYSIYLPKNSLCDSSGKGITELYFSISADDFLHSTGEIKLPNVQSIAGKEYNRFTGGAEFFYHENEFTVITPLGAGRYLPEGEHKFEFARFDYNGNLLQQTIIDSPFFKNFYIMKHYIVEAGNGSYIVFCSEIDTSTVDLIFCIDKDGVLKWVNDDYHGSGAYFYGYRAFKHKDGLAFAYVSNANGEFGRYFAYVDPDTGEILPYEGVEHEQMFNLSGGRLLRVTGSSTVRWEIIDSESYESLAYIDFPRANSSNDYTIQYLNDNGDGTITAACTTDGGNNLVAFLLDACMNVIKSKEIANRNVYDITQLKGSAYDITWLKDGGFCVVRWVKPYVDTESLFRIYRYDRQLNLVWTEYVQANYIYHFITPDGDILAYKSLFHPTPECYIVSYESENEKIDEHVHSISYVQGRDPTCVKNGICGYWHCSECGVMYRDEGGSHLIINISDMLTLANGHVEEIIPATPSSCTRNGNTEGVKCSVCEVIIKTPIILPQWEDHFFTGGWSLSKRANCMEEGEQFRSCAGGCGLKEIQTLPIDKNEHAFLGSWVVVKEANCINEGLLKRECQCGYTETLVISVSDYHESQIWSEVKKATCSEDGLKVRVCTLCAKELDRVTIPASDKYHVYGNWTTIYDSAYCGNEAKIEKCTVCDKELSVIGKQHVLGDWTTVTECNCITDGFETRNCTVCDQELDRRTSPASDKYHIHGDWITVSEPSCTADGLKTISCTLCGKELNRQTNPASDKYHVAGEWITISETSCHEDGLKVKKCTVCDSELNRQVTPQSDKYHVAGEWITISETSCHEDGLKVKKCTVCDSELNRQVTPQSDKYHVAGEWSVTKSPTESEFGIESQLCRECGKTMNTRSIDKISPSDGEQNDSTIGIGNSHSNGFVGAIVVGALSIIILASVFCVFIFKKKT